MKLDFSTGKVRAFILLIVLLILYSPVLSASFRSLDDQTMIVNNSLLRDWQNIPVIFKQSFFGDGSFYRPLVTLNYMVDYHAFGLNPFFYYLENILIHALNSLLVMLLISNLTRYKSLGWWAALVFAIHPVQWEAVANISGRAILLCAAFGLLSFHYLVQSRRGERGGFRSVFFFMLALLCKESAFMLPFVFAFYLWSVEPYERKKLRRFLLKLEAFLIVILAYLILRHAFNITADSSAWVSIKYNILGILTFLTGLLTYLRIFIFPAGLHFDRSAALFTSFTNPALLAVLLTYAVAIFIFFRNKKKTPRLAGLFIVWFLLELFPVSQIIASLGTMPGRIALNEHFLYVPAVSLSFLLVWAAQRLLQINKSKRLLSDNAVKILTMGVLLGFCIVTIQQNIYASSETAMYRRSLSISPKNSRIRNTLAFKYAKEGKFAEAEAEYRRVLENDKNNKIALIGMTQSLCDQGKKVECITLYENMAANNPDEPLVRGNLTLLYREWFDELRIKIKEDPLNPQIHFNIGKIYTYLGYTDEAAGAFENALRIDRNHAGAIFQLGKIHENRGEWEKAAAFYVQFISISAADDKSEATDGIRRIYTKLGRPEIAEKIISEIQK